MSRIAVMGDVGGHFTSLQKELIRLGANDDLELPDDLTIIQIGDIVHRGPDSDLVVEYINRQLNIHPDRWIQLLGNHECYYFFNPHLFDWDKEISPASQEFLLDWWNTDKAKLAVSFSDKNGKDYLVTHAGITFSFWERRLGKPEKAASAARKINAMKEYDLPTLLHSGVMIEGKDVDGLAGPIWAEATREVNPGWMVAENGMPFNQIHGHSVSYDWYAEKFQNTYTGTTEVTIEKAKKHVHVPIGEREIIEIDPNHTEVPQLEWESIVFEDAILH